jgi:hypothetical protein
VHSTIDAGQRKIAVQMGWCGNRHGINAGAKQAIDIGESRTAKRARHEIALLLLRIGNANQRHARQIGEYACMVAAHDADADNADPQHPIRVIIRGLSHVARPNET